MKKPSILLVDDDKMVAEIGKIMLEGLSYKVASITDSLEALKRFIHHPSEFDLLITDYNMPDMNRGRLSLQLRMTHKDLPIILATANKDISEEHIKPEFRTIQILFS